MGKVNVEKDRDSNSKMFIIIGIVVIVVAILVALLVMGLGKSNNRKDLEKSLSDMGKDFYENFYYEQVGSSADEKTTLLSKFSEVGIKIDLDNLERYNNGEFKDEIGKFKNSKSNEKCSKTNTKVIIYPKSPYGKTDYKIETQLDCGFDEK